jgi:hypothetical protein
LFNTWGNGDYGYVEVREAGSSAWTRISANYDDYSGTWTYALLDLKAYGGKTIQIAFHFLDDGGDTGYPNYSPTITSGWYIDEVAVVSGAWVFNNPERFENGLGDWSSERGVWAVAAGGHSGNYYLDTVPGGIIRSTPTPVQSVHRLWCQRRVAAHDCASGTPYQLTTAVTKVTLR